MTDNDSIKPHFSRYRKCPIYTHNVAGPGDYLSKPRKKTKTKSKEKSVLEKLEETYWANWKPDNSKQKIDSRMSTKKSLEIQVIKGAPSKRRHKIQMYPCPGDHHETQVEKIEQVLSKSQEIQTDDIPKTSESTDNSVSDFEAEKKLEEDIDNKFLRHTDSFILNMKRQHEEKEYFDQPKCIRLYKKPTKYVSKNYIRGGSYPLKSCLKKESNFSKGSHRMTRPRSPLIVSSNFSNKKYNKINRH